SYPQGWKVTKSNAGVTFTDPNGIAYVAIRTSPNPNAFISSDSLVTVGLDTFKSQAKNYQKQTVSPTTTIAGDTWSQGAATGDVTPSGKSSPQNVKIVIIADNHPAKATTTKAFVIAYATGSQIFDLANITYFQPILQSFKFV